MPQDDPVSEIFSGKQRRAPGSGARTGKSEVSALPSRRKEQTNWSYSIVRDRGGHRLVINEADRHYQWKIPEKATGIVGGGGPGPVGVTRLSDLDSHDAADAGGSVVSSGPLQVHSSSPGEIYATAQDGSVNPTFRLSLEDGSWTMSPAASPRRPDPAARLAGMAKAAAPAPATPAPGGILGRIGSLGSKFFGTAAEHDARYRESRKPFYAGLAKAREEIASAPDERFAGAPSTPFKNPRDRALADHDRRVSRIRGAEASRPAASRADMALYPLYAPPGGSVARSMASAAALGAVGGGLFTAAQAGKHMVKKFLDPTIGRVARDLRRAPAGERDRILGRLRRENPALYGSVVAELGGHGGLRNAGIGALAGLGASGLLNLAGRGIPGLGIGGLRTPAVPGAPSVGVADGRLPYGGMALGPAPGRAKAALYAARPHHGYAPGPVAGALVAGGVVPRGVSADYYKRMVIADPGLSGYEKSVLVDQVNRQAGGGHIRDGWAGAAAMGLGGLAGYLYSKNRGGGPVSRAVSSAVGSLAGAALFGSPFSKRSGLRDMDPKTRDTLAALLKLQGIFAGALLGRAAISARARRDFEKAILDTPRVTLSEGKGILSRSGLAPGVPIIQTRVGGSGASYMGSGATAAEIRNSPMFEEEAGKLRRRGDSRPLPDLFGRGLISVSPEFMREGVILHEGAHAGIASGAMGRLPKVNQKVLRPISAIGGLAVPSAAALTTAGLARLGGIRGPSMARALAGAAIGGGMGLLAGLPTYLNEMQATSAALRAQRELGASRSSLEKSRRALGGGLRTYLVGGIAAPALTGAGGAAIAPLGLAPAAVAPRAPGW